MNNKLIALFLLTAAILCTSCQDELADRYGNPDKTTTPTIDKFFTAMLNNNRVRPMYWEMSTFVNWHIGIYTQSVGFLNSPSIYQQNDSYVQDRWNDFYRPSPNGAGVVAHYREIERAYAALSENDKQNSLIFLMLAQVVFYDQATQMVDLWGDIPLTESGMLNKTGTTVYPKFDASTQVYTDALVALKNIADYLATAQLSSSTQSLFAKQDVMLNGNIDRWRRYVNSLRLRLLMRISFVNETFARSEVMRMLEDPASFPLLNDIDYHPATDDVLLTPLSNYTDDLHAAFADWTNYSAPYFMLEEVLKPTNDLRIPVLFDKFGSESNNQFISNTEYKAMPLNLSRVEQQAALGKYAIVDSTTFLYNSKLPGVVLTTSEVNFLKAEAFERWGGGDAGSEYLKGIENSIVFYYYLNSLNTTRSRLLPPTNQMVTEFLTTNPAILYEGSSEEKLAKTWTQKWVHFGFLQVTQRWAEQRRTTFPKLAFIAASLNGFELPPARLTYPPSEKTLNPNYKAVADQDIRSRKIFWDVR